MVLGSFSGPLACTRIAKGKGVCGTLGYRPKTLIVPDVNALRDTLPAVRFPFRIVVPVLERTKS